MPKKDTKKEETVIAKTQNQKITETIEQNYMPYAMSVIVSRAIPEIDGLKPSHRKLLYTMYKMGLLSPSSARTKSANIVGQTMKLNPHGEGAIYETLVRLTRGSESLLHPLIDSKGSFGKQYSRDMAYAASRYTECKLDGICSEFFDGIDRDAVDFKDNYDNTQKEPCLLPTAFPNILVSPNQGVAVGLASQICSFNLAEICDTAILLLKNEHTPVKEIMQVLKAPDFSTGGQLLYNHDAIKEIYETGRGSFKIRARYNFDKTQNCIDIYQIPYTATVESIQERIELLCKDGKLRDINDIRDETDINGLKITIDLKRGTDPDKLMQRLYKSTPLEDSFSCNFNILISGSPKQLGIRDILCEWIWFRIECIKRELFFDLSKKREKLHLLNGLAKILLDIDKAIRIIRETKLEKDVIPNLCSGFDIDDLQAEYIAEIKLRYLNREYLLSKTDEIEQTRNEIAELESILQSGEKQRRIIIKQLENIKKKHGKPRMTQIIYDFESEPAEIEEIEEYNVYIVLTKDGYFKKITSQSLRGNDEQKLKENDEIILETEAKNTDEILFFSDKGQVYKTKINDFDNVKASVLGDYIPAKLEFDEGEKVFGAVITKDYSGTMLFFFKNGKTAKIPLSVYITKTNRKKLTGAYSTASPLASLFYQNVDSDYLLISSDSRAAVVNSKIIPEKTTRTTIGVDTLALAKSRELAKVELVSEGQKKDLKKFYKDKLPARGLPYNKDDVKKEQLLIDGI